MIVKLVREGLGRVFIAIDLLTRPQPIHRPETEQRALDGAAKGLALYQFHACPFCIRARRAIHRLNVPIELRDAQHDRRHRTDLQQEGGRVQVPCLRIDEADDTVWLYESADIIRYLEQRFAPAAVPSTAG